MSAELSITLNRLIKEATSVVGSGRTHAQAVTDVLDQRVVTEEGQPRPDFMVLQLTLVQMVEDELEQIETHDESLVDELDEDRDQLAERIDATAELTDELSGVQSACDGVYGNPASLRLFGQVKTLPRDPRLLVTLGRRVHRRLADPEYAFPEPKLKGWPLEERETVATDLGRATDRLDTAIDALTHERKASASNRFFKSGAFDRFRRTLRHASGCLASLYGLAGFDELAANIRPKRRRRRRAADDSGGEPNEPQATEPASENGGDTTPEQPTGPTLVVS